MRGRAPGQEPASQACAGLKANALGLGDVVVVALAGAGPAQRIAAGMVGLMLAVGYGTLVPLLLCFLAMLAIAVGYERLGAWRPSAGATYSWASRTMPPLVGVFAGWIMLLYYAIGTATLGLLLGACLLGFFSDSAANDRYDVALVGSILSLVALIVAALGVRPSALFSRALVLVECVLLVGFVVAAVVTVDSVGLSGMADSLRSSLTLPRSGLLSGILIAIFLFSGWEAAAVLGEETRDRRAGRAGLVGVVLLFLLYSVAIVAFQRVAPFGTMQANQADILAFVGAALGGPVWQDVMIAALLCGTLASLQVAIVGSGRISFAMGRDGALPAFLAAVHPRWRTPWNATILVGLLDVAFLWGATLLTPVGDAVAGMVASLGLLAAMVYLLTAASAVWHARRAAGGGVAGLVLGGILPGLGGGFMAVVIVASAMTGRFTATVLIVLGLALGGLILSLLAGRVRSRVMSASVAPSPAVGATASEPRLAVVRGVAPVGDEPSSRKQEAREESLDDERRAA